MKLHEKIHGIIDKLALGGKGILRKDGFVLFVPFTLPQEEVEVEVTSLKKNYGEAKLLQVLKPSPERVEPHCPYFGVCGGCQLQHMSYPAQLEHKRQIIQESFAKIGKMEIPPVEIVAAPKQYGYRERITLHIQGLEVGYRGCDPSQFVPISMCPIFLDEPSSLFDKIKSHLTPDSEGRVEVLKTPNDFLLHFHFKNRPEDVIEKEILGLKIQYTSGMFIQNYFEQSVKLYQEIVSKVTTSPCLDLYSGIGITSLLLAKRGIETTGVEYNKGAVKAARNNQTLNQLKTATFIASDVLTALKGKLKDKKFESMVVNPPREGLTKEIISHLGAPQLIYISCDPATLARDSQEILKRGYRLKSVKAFDMFPQTAHVETLVHFLKTA